MIITVAHQKGGVGKSTLVTNLCGYLKTDLLDMDKQFSSTAWNALRIENENRESRYIRLRSRTARYRTRHRSASGIFGNFCSVNTKEIRISTL